MKKPKYVLTQLAQSLNLTSRELANIYHVDTVCITTGRVKNKPHTKAGRAVRAMCEDYNLSFDKWWYDEELVRLTPTPAQPELPLKPNHKPAIERFTSTVLTALAELEQSLLD